MRRSRILIRTVALLGAAGIAFAVLPASPATAKPKDKQDRVTVCHTKKNGQIEAKAVRARSVSRWLERGAAFPGAPVPGQPGWVFDENCVVKPFFAEPSEGDSDGDGLADWHECLPFPAPPNPEDEFDFCFVLSDRFNPDTDGDGLSDGGEILSGTDPNNADSDYDGLDDGAEVAIGTNPNSDDTDADGLSDYDEQMVHGTDPRLSDTDRDGVSDGDEIANGTDPLKRRSK